jgi:hypothetical protein
MAISETISSFAPDFSGIGTVITIFAWGILFLMVFVIGFYYYNRAIKYKYKIVIWGNVNGRMTIIGKDRGMKEKLNETGDVIMTTLKNKKKLPFPEIQMGKNTYWMAIRSDQEWINIGIEGIDEKSKEMKLDFTDHDMRYNRAGLQKNLKERFIVKDFWDKYGTMIMNISYVAIIGIMAWLMMDKWVDVMSSINSIIAQLPELLDRMEDLVVAMENLNQGGSGFQPAT